MQTHAFQGFATKFYANELSVPHLSTSKMAPRLSDNGSSGLLCLPQTFLLPHPSSVPTALEVLALVFKDRCFRQNDCPKQVQSARLLVCSHSPLCLVFLFPCQDHALVPRILLFTLVPTSSLGSD